MEKGGQWKGASLRGCQSRISPIGQFGDDDYNASAMISSAPVPQPSDMSLLRPQYTSRLLHARVPIQQCILPSHIRYASKTSSGEYQDRSAQPAPKSDASTSPAPTSGDSSMIRQQDSSEGMVDHQPNYHAPIDHATS